MCTTLPEGWAIDSCFFWKTRKGKGCASYSSHPFVFSKEIKGRNPELDFSSWTMEHLTECTDCQMLWWDDLLNLSARTHWSVRKRVSGTYTLHLRVLCRCFFREQERGPDGIAMETELILFIYLFTYLCMHVFKPWLPLMAYLGSHPVSGDFVHWKWGNVKCWLLVSNSKVQ